MYIHRKYPATIVQSTDLTNETLRYIKTFARNFLRTYDYDKFLVAINVIDQSRSSHSSEKQLWLDNNVINRSIKLASIENANEYMAVVQAFVLCT